MIAHTTLNGAAPILLMFNAVIAVAAKSVGQVSECLRDVAPVIIYHDLAQDKVCRCIRAEDLSFL